MHGSLITSVVIYQDTDATLDDLREAVTTLEEIERTARRVMGGAHPLTKEIEGDLQYARATHRVRVRSLLPYGASAVAVAVIAWVWRRFLT